VLLSEPITCDTTTTFLSFFSFASKHLQFSLPLSPATASWNRKNKPQDVTTEPPAGLFFPTVRVKDDQATITAHTKKSSTFPNVRNVEIHPSKSQELTRMSSLIHDSDELPAARRDLNTGIAVSWTAAIQLVTHYSRHGIGFSNLAFLTTVFS
jgi:hypothetical protein